MKKIIFCFATFAVTTTLPAQDVHWAQPTNCLLYQNPAFTAISNKFDLDLDYRTQWNAINTSYKSYMVAGDYRFGAADPGNVSFCIGGIFYNDIAGDGSYRRTNSGVTFASNVKVSDHLRMGAGLGYNIIQSGVKMDNFSWGTQFDGQNYDPSLSSGEMQGTQSKWYSDLNAGVSWLYEQNPGTISSNDNTKFIFGYSINHINRPDISLNGGTDKLNIKHTLYFTGLIGLKNKNVSIKPTAFFYHQGKLNEITAGSLFRFTIGEHSKITGFKKGSAFSFGALYRVKDALMPTVEYEKGNFLFGMSYDINISTLTPASHFRGGMEFTLCLVDIGSYLYKQKDAPEEP
jgi:type IX secretion system PorP/SprF family membrane protein